MSKWIVNLNDEQFEFESFLDGVNYFKNKIKDHFQQYNYDGDDTKLVVYTQRCVPDFVGYFLEGDYKDLDILDEEIILDTRLSMLMQYMFCLNIKEVKDAAKKIISKPIKYHGENNEYGSLLDVDISPSTDELVVNLKGEDMHLKTNAFIFDDENKTYYLDSHQECLTSHNPDHLGVYVDFNISLTKQ